jgi:transcriptional regulator with XRE-family HTH domain
VPTVTKFDFPAVGEQLEKAAERLGLSQIKLAKMSGVSRRQIGLAFKGANISLATLAKLARVLRMQNVAMGDLSVAAQETPLDPDLREHARFLLFDAEQQVREASAILFQDREQPGAAAGATPKTARQTANERGVSDETIAATLAVIKDALAEIRKAKESEPGQVVGGRK